MPRISTAALAARVCVYSFFWEKTVPGLAPGRGLRVPAFSARFGAAFRRKKNPVALPDGGFDAPLPTPAPLHSNETRAGKSEKSANLRRPPKAPPTCHFSPKKYPLPTSRT